ncbi:MAG: NAD(+)/NADH kinase [Chloroflexi bacterium]|nr:NAD(+)/NADH kinase [Chloroflexota bacterium]
MKRIGILYHPRRKDSLQLASEVTRFLHHRQIDVWQGSADDEEALVEAAPSLEVLITMGGDGTIVRAVRCVAAFGVPILGMNLGRLGFLTEVEPGHAKEALAHLLAGAYSVEERMMLRVALRRGEATLLTAEAINDLVVARGLASRTVQVSIAVDGHHVMTPTADGVIVATPTGSTAYCLAAGGPIVAPDLNCLTITPIAAHLGIAHAFVVPARRSLCLELVKGDGAMLTLDGHADRPLEPGDQVLATASPNSARFIRFGGDGYFYETVLRRLRWPDRDSTA